MEDGEGGAFSGELGHGEAQGLTRSFIQREDSRVSSGEPVLGETVPKLSAEVFRQKRTVQMMPVVEDSSQLV